MGAIRNERVKRQLHEGFKRFRADSKSGGDECRVLPDLRGHVSRQCAGGGGQDNYGQLRHTTSASAQAVRGAGHLAQGLDAPAQPAS